MNHGYHGLRFALILLLLALPALSLTGPLAAQEATPEASADGLITVSGWITTEADEDAPDDPVYTIFLDLADGETILEIGTGADVVYTRQADGTYSGAPLVPTDAYTLEATLEIVDDETRQSNSTLSSTAFTSETSRMYTRSDAAFSIWVEGDRTLTEYSLFAECLGLTSATPPRTFATADPIVPVRIDEEAGLLWIGDWELTGSGTYTRETEEPFGQFNRVTTEVAVVDPGAIQFSYHAIADERDDCELRYTSIYTPFDGDLEALLGRAIELGG